MDGALTGGLIGVAIAVVLYYFEYSMLTKEAKERVKLRAVKKVQLDSTARARLRSLGAFCLFLPFLCAGLGWILL